jgi:hypothetical protein
MFLTVHATAAIVITQGIQNPIIAFIIGFISHYFTDIIPHGDEQMFDKYNEKQKIAVLAVMAMVDFVVLFFWLNFLLWQNKLPNLEINLVAILASTLPDFINGIYLITKAKFLKPMFDFHFWVHFVLQKKPVAVWLGLSCQTLFFAGLIAILFLKF